MISVLDKYLSGTDFLVPGKEEKMDTIRRWLGIGF